MFGIIRRRDATAKPGGGACLRAPVTQRSRKLLAPRRRQLRVNLVISSGAQKLKNNGDTPLPDAQQPQRPRLPKRTDIGLLHMVTFNRKLQADARQFILTLRDFPR
jgi:hypothetical protein